MTALAALAALLACGKCEGRSSNDFECLARSLMFPASFENRLHERIERVKKVGKLFIFVFIFFRGRFFFWGFLVLCFPVSLIFCFSASLLTLLLCFSCFSAFLLLYFSAFCFPCFSAFPVSLLFCFLLFLLFGFPVSLLFCFSVFPAALLLYFCAFLLLLLLFYFFFSSVMCFCCSTSCSFASLLPVFTVSLFFIFFCFILFCLYPK